MSSSRWRKLESLFGRVMEVPGPDRDALLREAGESDAALEEEVRRLAAIHDEDVEFLEGPEPLRVLAPGSALGDYTAGEVLGAGGMGVVYRAHRGEEAPCAIKVLRPEALEQPSMRRRFDRECEALRSLRHPNIVQVYGVERDSGGQHLLVMELLEGELLSQRINGRALPLETALGWAARIASALSAAHAAGLVHRDVKPQNVMVTTSGLVKLLDFGLCRWSRASRSPESRTYDGMLVGTAPYMSPEQAQGLEVDARSDVFSFGAVFHEMLSGSPPFEGPNPIATLAAILHREPPPLARVPRQVKAVIDRCLKKETGARYASGAELAEAMERLREESRMGRLRQARTPVGKSWKWAAATAGVAACASMGWWFRPAAGHPAEPMQQILTPDFYLATHPAVSPDGKSLAFSGSKEGEGPMDIWVRPLAGGAARQVTNEVSGAQDPAFSPDGRTIVYRSDSGGGQLLTVPAAGGRPRFVAAKGRRPRYSPDGKRIAYWIGPEGSNDLGRAGAAKVFVVSVDGGAPRPVGGDLPSAYAPVWSPDGRAVLVMAPRRLPEFPQPAVWLARLDGGPSRMVHDLAGVAPDGGEPLEWRASGTVSILGAARDGWPIVEMTVSPVSWTVEREPVALSVLPKQSSRPARVGDRLILGNTVLRTSLRTLHLGRDGRATGPARMELNCPGTFCMPWLADEGRNLAYAAYQTRWTLRTKALAEEEEKRLDTAADPSPWIAMDGAGRHLYVHAGDGRSSSGTIFRQPIRGGRREAVCARCAFPWDVSPDERFLLAKSEGKLSAIGLARLPAEKEIPYLVHPEWNLYRARFSPDGRWILFYARPVPDAAMVMAARFHPDKPPAPETWVALTTADSFNGPAVWGPRGDRIYYASDRDGYRCIWTQAIDPGSKQPAGQPVSVAHFHNAARSLKNVPIGLFGLSVSGDTLAYELGDLSGKIHVTAIR